jgi:hypothetical protein
MDKAEARRTKAELAGFVRDLLERRVEAESVGPPPSGVALGLAPQPGGGFGVAVRYRLGVPTTRMVARRVADHVGPVVDVRRTGRIHAIPGTRSSGRWGTAPRPPVITALSVGETGRVRPLRPGVSIAHVTVTAGTLGAFVTVDGRTHALSNYHVLVGSPSSSVGDPVLQPGPADGGRMPQDKVGELAAFGTLERGGRFVVDCAVALLDDQDVDPTYPIGAVTRTAAAEGAEEVEKTGRTTGTTRGHVTAIELDDVVVGYGAELGELTFDNQIEVEGLAGEPFSRGGDSGSLVYRTSDGVAIGLLFAGSETGGENGTGLTYLNPIDPVLETFGATLVG